MNKSLINKLSAHFYRLFFSLFLTSFAVVSYAATLSGVIADKNGAPIEGASALLFKLVGGSLIQTGAIIQVSNDGLYSWTIDDGDYVLRAFFNSSDVSLVGAPNTVTVQTEDFTVDGDTVRNSTFDFFLLSGQIVDSNNIAVAGVDLQTTQTWRGPEIGVHGKLSLYNITHSNKSSVSDDSGQYNLLMFSTDTCIASGFNSDSNDCLYDITFKPTVESGFANAVELDYAVTNDQILDAQLSFSDLILPKIIIGPYVRNLTDNSAVIEWLTDEASSSSVTISGGATLTDPRLLTFHSLVVTTLTANTDYSAQVSSTDKQDNQSAIAPVNFSTLSDPDITAPLFIQSPTVKVLGDQQFTLSFCADEPVNGKVVVDDVDHLFIDFSVCHEIVIDNLSANRRYSVLVSISDIATNGPTVSQQESVTTLAASDLTPPIILIEPVIIDVSDSTAVVLWTTNEASTSAISFNDGSNYRVLISESLSTQHSAQLTGLSANTEYTLNVSSTDASGNGPTLSSTVEFDTSTTPDTNSPLFLGQPMVQNITSNSAIINWLTDESSSTLVFLGSQANNLDRIETSADFLANHQIVLTGLTAATTYFFKVESIDIAGNNSVSNVFSFTTNSVASITQLEIFSGPLVEQLSGNSMTVSWRTNFAADSRLVCESVNGMIEVNKLELKKNHILTLTGLEFNTGYRCVVYSTDVEGFIASKTIDITTTDQTDTVAPQCTIPPSITAFGSFAEISWQSDELATAIVQYRVKGEANWRQNASLSLDQSGFILLTGLQENTDYEQQLGLTDTVGNSANCILGEFNSGAIGQPADPVFSIQPFVTDIGGFSAVINWQTETVSSGQVRVGLSESSLSKLGSDPQFALSHSVIVNDLQPATTYFVRVDAFNLSGAVTVSNIISFFTHPIPPSDLIPAKIIAGPVVRNITNISAVIEWQTDKPADSTVVVAGGSTFAQSSPTTLHSVSITGLTPDTLYITNVFSSDENGNTTDPVEANFTTLTIPDTTLPAYIIGPSISAIDYNQFTVSFCADEPVTGLISIDSIDYLLGPAQICHQLNVTGLTPNTEYLVECAITDIAGNGPVMCTSISATTRLNIDISAPIITGPVVTDVTNSTAIIRWTTNESATSGVSYTDGTVSDEFYDNESVLNHVVYLSGLMANTTYTLTASSTDQFGNGPNSSQPVEFTTFGLADTTTPQIMVGPFVEDITSNSAYILWTTNETASHLVELGLAENSLNQTFTVAGLSSDHIVPVTALSPETLYYFQVKSSDLAGNRVTSPVLSFTTLKASEIPLALQITDGPNVENAAIDSLTISWLTNLNADSRLVCQAEQNSMAQNSLGQLAESFFVEPSMARLNEIDPDKAIANQYIVIFRPQTSTGVYSKSSKSLSELTLQERQDSINLMALDIASQVNGQVLRQYANAVSGFVIKMSASEIPKLRQDPRILMIEQDQKMQASVTQSGATWGLDRIDQTDLPLSSDYTYNLDGSGVNAYVIDTGVLTSHSDFGGRASSGWDFVDNDPDATDCNGHGTHVAGTLGSTTWGVAKNVNIIAVRVLGCSGSGTNSGVIGGIDWVTQNAVMPAVANMSLGGGNSIILDTAVNNAINAGITFAVAAGNSNINACSGSPNKVPAAITVASSTINDVRSNFSNWGSCIDIFAPGSDITSTWSNGGINTISGTSMASPHVAGVAALYLQAHPNSTPAEVDAGLAGFASKDKISNLNGSPNLLLNMQFDAGSEILPPPPPPPIENIQFEIGDSQRSKTHLLTLTGLQSSTIYQCSVHSTDIDGNQVSKNIRATSNDIPDVIPPVCNGETGVSAFIDSAQISWGSDELTTAVVNYRTTSADNWQQKSRLEFAKNDSLILTGLLAETDYQQQVTLTDQSGNSTQCAIGNFTTLAPGAIANPVFTLQPLISNIDQQSVTVSWTTLEASSANLRYGLQPTALLNNQIDSQLIKSHSVNLQNLVPNTTYYLQVDAFNILGVSTASEIVNFTTSHPNNDFDQDGIVNNIDNCPVTPNPDQLDSDNDGLGDVCDEAEPPNNDFDSDGVLNAIDNCPINPNPDQLDSDNDGIGDVCDAPIIPNSDFDGDGILDDVDNCPTIANFDQLDSNNNGIGDACDIPEVITPPPPQPTGINLRGVITGEGNPLTGAVVVIYDNQRQFLQSVTTPTDGSYLFKFIAAGEYFIGVTPPVNTGFSAPPLQPVSIADRDVVRLITLVGDAITLSGLLQDSQGRAIDNVLVSLHIQTTGNQVGNSLRTDENGRFEFAVAPGTYKIRPVIDLSSSPQQDLSQKNSLQQATPIISNYPVPDFAAIFYALQNIQVSSNTQLDVVLPFALLSGQTQDSSGNSIAGVALSIHHQFSTLETDYYLDNYATDVLSNAISDASGHFEFAIFTDQPVDILLSPPADRLDLAVTTIKGYNLAADTSEIFALVAGVSLSGRLLDTNGRAIDNTKVSLHAQDSGLQIGQAIFTDNNGAFQFQVEAGSYKIQPHLNPFGRGESQRPAYPLPDFATVLFAQQNILVSANTSQDVILPLAILTGTTTNQAGQPIADTRIAISHIEQQIGGSGDISYLLESQGRSLVSHAKTDVNGQFSVALFTNQAMDISFVPSQSDRQVASTLVKDYMITQDTTDSFVLDQSLTLSGFLKDSQGNVIDNTLITVHSNTNNQLADAPSLTDANGRFEFKVAAGDYKLRPYLVPVNNVGGVQVSPSYPVPDFAAVYYLAKDLTVSADLEIDIVIPMSLLSGKTLDANGVEVAGVKLRIDHAFAEDSISYYLENHADVSESNALSDQNGLFGFALFTHQSTDISVNPPIGSGFAITIVNHNLDQETSEDIFLQHQDRAPKIIFGPEITRISDRTAIVDWRTDKPAKGIVQLSNGRTIEADRLTTHNRLLLSDLQPLTNYTVTVQAIDKNNQTSASESTNFTTTGTPYSQAPVFISGPAISNISQTQFEISFCADGPVTGIVAVSSNTFILSELDVCHSLEVEDLEPNTDYIVAVDISDPLGNGPTSSEPQNVTTLTQADITPPAILLLPFVTDISATEATVIWTTDEQANSGVSYNDGDQYHVVTEAVFVYQHSLQLTDLTEDTTYTLTVSSTDADGNGATLSEPISFTTLSDDDDFEPVIIGSPLIQNITDQSAVIRWQTDEPTSTSIVIGLSPSNMDSIETHGEVLTTNHNLAVTGLEPETHYYLQVHSQDAGGNLVLGEVISFITKEREHQEVPHFMEDVEVEEVSSHSVTVSWRTKVNADGRLVCTDSNQTLQVNHVKRTKKHDLTLTGLTENSSYSCAVFSSDHDGFTATQTIEDPVQTKFDSKSESSLLEKKVSAFWAILTGSQSKSDAQTEPDNRAFDNQSTSNDQKVPTTIEEPIINGFGGMATVKIVTDELTAVQLQYRVSGSSVWQQAGTQDVQLNHLIVIAGLTANTDYQLQYLLVNILGESSLSNMIVFNSGVTSNLLNPEFSSQPVMTEVTINTAQISWDTVDIAFAQVSYSNNSDSLMEKESNLQLTTNHSVSLVRLDPATIYFAQVTAYNIAGTEVLSQVVSFTTSAVDNLVDSDNDGLPDFWEIEHSLNPQDPLDAGQDNDNDGLTNREEYANLSDPNNPDSDGDGMPDGWEVDHSLDPNDPSDADEDADGDGVSNLNEYLNANDKEPPVITLNTEITIDAIGILTQVPTSNISANDNIDGAISVSLIGDTHLRSGFHLVDWLAQDAAGNKTFATQIIRIRPRVLISKSQLTAEGNNVSLEVNLSGSAADYPVQIPFTLSGTANSDDHDLIQSSFIIEEGLSAQITVEIIQDGVTENDEQLIINLATPVNAILDLNSRHIINIGSSNIAPMVNLHAMQNGKPITSATWTDGPVTIYIDIDDPNLADQHVVDWGNADNALIDIDPVTHALTFDPVNVSLGVYDKTANVTDDGSPALLTSSVINLQILAEAPTLSATIDTDGDGISDADEGFQDSDLDGIPDHLDSIDSSNILQLQVAGANDNSGTFLLETEAGVTLTLGRVALSANPGGALVDDTTLVNSELFNQHGQDTFYNIIGGLVDYEMHRLPEIGSSVRLLIPQQQSIPADAVYRKLDPINGWQSFIVNSNNLLYSAQGDEGICPSPGDPSYTLGLTQGHWCLMMLIEDGGVNDSDDTANGTIIDPGGVSQPITAATLFIPNINSVVEEQNFVLTATVTANGNEIVSFLWEQISGPTAAITNSANLNATVISAPVGTLTFRLTIKDAIDRTVSDEVSVEVTQKAVVPPPPPPPAPPPAPTPAPSTDSGGGAIWLLLLIAAGGLGYRRKKKS